MVGTVVVPLPVLSTTVKFIDCITCSYPSQFLQYQYQIVFEKESRREKNAQASLHAIGQNSYNMVTEGLMSRATAPRKSQQGNVTHFLHRFSTQLDAEEQNGLSLLIAESLSGYCCYC